MKLELKHLAPYFPYGLKITHPLGVFNLTGLRETDMQMALLENESDVLWGYLYESKPILHPMSDLIQPEHITKIGYRSLSRNGGESYTLSQYEYLFENHFDVFGLIPAGLAIDINTLDKEL